MSEPDKVAKRRATAENWAVRSRNYRRARERALTRLAQIHKEEYLELLEQEKEKDEKEGKRWHNLAGADVRLDSNPATNSASKAGRNTSDISQDKGNDV